MLRQASMLAYKNAFAVLAAVILCLTPLPFLMRLPQEAEKPAPEELAAH
jgi:DHA2 family multidrug resistance protein